MSTSQSKNKDKGKSKGKTIPWRYMYFGYIITDEWLLNYARQNKLEVDMTGKSPDIYDEVGSNISEATLDVMAKAQIYFSSTLGTVMSPDQKPLCCLVLATNDPLDKLPLPPPKKWAKLKEILGTEKDPCWYFAVT